MNRLDVARQIYRVARPLAAGLTPFLPRGYPTARGYPTMAVGSKVSVSKAFTPAEIQQFADISLDNNPVHIDQEYAKGTKFGGTIVHGVLNVGLTLSLLGNTLPGPGTVLLNYEVDYPAPLYVGEKVTAEVELVKLVKRAATFSMTCTTDDGKITSRGTATVLAPKESLSD